MSFGGVPTYVYKFVETGETIEVQQSLDDPTLTETTHPVTGASMPVKKVFQPVGVTFRGTGFYKTDSRGGSSSKSATSSSTDGAKPDGAKSDSTKSESTKSESSKPSTPAASTSSTSSD